MSTLKATNIKNESSASNNIVLDSGGGVVVSGVTTVTAGSASAPAISFNDSNTGLYSPGADQLALSTGGVGRVFVDASGRFGVGTASPGYALDVKTSAETACRLDSGSGYNAILRFAQAGVNKAFIQYPNGGGLTFGPAGSEAARLDSSGRLLVGTSTARSNFYNTTADAGFLLEGTGAQRRAAVIGDDFGAALILGMQKSGAPGGNTIVVNGDGVGEISFQGNDGSEFVACAQIKAEIDNTPGANDMPGRLVFSTTANGASAPTERARINSDGIFQIGATNFAKSSTGGLAVSSTLGTGQGAANSGSLAYFNETNSGNGAGLWIGAYANQTTGVIGSTTATGNIAFQTYNSGWGERMRIASDGTVFIGKTVNDFTTEGVQIRQSAGTTGFVTGGGTVATFSRTANDGTIISLRQDGIEEGSISVSGTTVSYNGAHLSRWSQILGIDPYNKAVRPEILRGTVMSNLDEMCDWTCPESGECQDNEQLNKTKISDVEGDKNVAGIFQSWDDDDDTWVNDYYLAMTGDFVIRIAAGTTVERGDLLMSAGDGTAKPQDDDIIRSKTIAKVTSINVSCTYEDGSYCVPCVLMAC